jgi:hypothetical protein
MERRIIGGLDQAFLARVRAAARHRGVQPWAARRSREPAEWWAGALTSGNAPCGTFKS